MKRVVLGLVVIAGCTIPEEDLIGTKCTTTCGGNLVCVNGTCQRSGSTAGGSAAGGTSGGGSTAGGATAGGMASAGGAAPGGGAAAGGDAGGSAPAGGTAAGGDAGGTTAGGAGGGVSGGGIAGGGIAGGGVAGGASAGGSVTGGGSGGGSSGGGMGGGTTAGGAGGGGLLVCAVPDGGPIIPVIDAGCIDTTIELNANVQSLKVFDVNQDGWPDIVGLHALGTDAGVILFVNQRDGSFTPTHRPLTSQPCTSTDRSNVAFGDFNHDCRMDMAVACRNGVELLETSASLIDYSFSRTVAAGTIGSRAFIGIAAGDLNNDGFDDLALADFQNYAAEPTPGYTWLQYGQADGGFFQRRIPTQDQSVATAIADMNNDGLKDVVVSFSKSQKNLVQVLTNRDGGAFDVTEHSTAPETPNAFALHDFNSDGLLDMAVCSNAGNTGDKVALLINDAGTLVRTTAAQVRNIPWDVAVGDLNGDGFIDLLVGSNFNPSNASMSGGLNLVRGTGPGMFGSSRQLDGGTDNTSVGVADFNRDGVNDVVFKSGPKIRVITSQGTGCPSIR